jgi:hypothetical protein
MLLTAADAGPAPWWAIPVIGGLFAVLGVLLTLAYNSRKDRRDHRRRWHADLKDATVAFTAAVHYANGASERGDQAKFESYESEARLEMQKLSLLPYSAVQTRAIDLLQLLNKVHRARRKARESLPDSGFASTEDADGLRVFAYDDLELEADFAYKLGYFHGDVAKTLGT